VLIAAAVVLVLLAVALASTSLVLSAVAIVMAAAVGVVAYNESTEGARDREGLRLDEIDRLRRAELALAAAPSTEIAARELGKHAMKLLEAPAAVVLLEGVGDNIRVEVGDGHGHSPYAAGSRMRLLDDDGDPLGSIAVAARPGRPYDERDERVLDALAQRVSSTLHRLSLFEKVRTEQRTLADVLGSSSDGIFSVGPDLRVRSWNPAMARLTGVAEVVALGQPCCAVFKPVDEEGRALHGGGCPARAGDAIEVVARLAGSDDTNLWLNCAFSPMSDGGCVVVARDVTTRKQIEDEKADFLATVSHELRTPLTPIKGFLQTLLRSDTSFDDEERRNIYSIMLREEGRLERLVQQLLQATSLDQVERLLVPVAVDWATAAAEQVDAVRRQEPDREISLIIAPDLPRVVADEPLAGQVLANLLSNACKFSRPDTHIGVAIAHDGHRVVTSVADAGPGIAVSDRDRIFEKFTRLGDHLTRPEQGVGLGLYIVRRSLEAMSGTVWVDETPGGGATFSFSLPLAPAESPARRKERRVTTR
jgi:PAS domain S-box-containing protein